MPLTIDYNGGRWLLLSDRTDQAYCQASVDLDSVASVPPLSLSLWFKHSGTPVQFDSLAGACDGAAWTQGLSLFFNSGTELRASFQKFNVDTVSGTVATPTNWNHAAVVHDGTDARLYVNGTLADTAASAQYGSMASPFTLYRVNEAADVAGDDEAWNWGGHIDDVRLFTRALTAGEITTLASARGAGTTTGIVAQYCTGDLTFLAAANGGLVDDATASMDLTITNLRLVPRDERTVTIEAQPRTARIQWD